MATYRDPFERLQAELEQMVQQAFAAFGPGGVYPPVNVFDAGDAFVIKAELPGLDPKAIELSVEDGALTLRGERKLPEPQAEYRDGVLTVRLAKAPESRPRRGEIQAA